MHRPEGDEATKANASGLKHEQFYEFGSAAWIAANGMPNGVESTNRSLKRSQYEDIADPDNRPTRGNTFTYIVAALATVVENLRQIMSFYKDRLALTKKTPKNQFLPSTYWDSADGSDEDEFALPATG
jgi:hypothetical protein